MKKTGKKAKRLGFLAIVLIAVIGFAMIACGGVDNAIAKVLVSIAVTNPPTKYYYEIDEEFNPDGMIVTGLYTDSSTEVIDNNKLTFGYDFSSEGAKSVTVTYQGIQSPISVPVWVYTPGSTTLESIKVTTLPTKLVYKLGESWSSAGMSITATYSDGTTSLVLGFLYDGFDSSTAGNKIITITYLGKTDTFSINVIDDSKETVATPVAAPTAGIFLGTQTVALSTTTPGATIYYTLDGSVPTTTTGTPYVDGTPISISTTTTIKAFAVKEGLNDSGILTALYEFQVAKPTATPGGGNYTTAQNVTLATTTDDAEIYYTTDGTDPTVEDGTLYDAVISVSAPTTIKAIAVKTGIDNSEILTVAYTFTVATPTASPAPGNLYFNTQNVTLSTISGTDADIYYTTDGNTPTTSSTKYTGPISVSTTSTIKAIAVKTGWTNSGVLTASYNFQASTPLTADLFADATMSASGTQWYKFTATATPQYIHFMPGTFTNAYIQLYESDGSTTVGAEQYFSASGNLNRTVTSGNVYFIKVRPYSGSGTYKIGFNAGTASPAIDLTNVNATELTFDNWSDGNIASAGGEQWFKFSAQATTQYVFFMDGTLSDVYVQLFTSEGRTQGDRSNVYISASSTNATSNASRANLNISSYYYIKVTPYSSYNSGTYKIGFTSTTTPPKITLPEAVNVTTLTINTWADGSITDAGGEQWFKFSAQAATQYIHFQTGTLTNVYVQLFTSEGRVSGTTRTIFNRNSFNVSRTGLTNSSDYYVRVRPYSSSSTGVYKIGFTASITPPSILSGDLPSSPTGLTTAGTWVSSSISAENGVQWFKFKATVTPQYIYFQPDTLYNVYVQLYASDGSAVGETANLSVTNLNINRTVTVNSDYYIKVIPYSSGGNGSFRIGFNGSTQPAVDAPSGTPTELSADTWTDGNIASAGGEQWFKFTSTAATQYIHFQPETLGQVYVQLYDDAYKTVTVSGTGSTITSLSNALFYTSRTLTLSNTYYIRVTPYSGSGTYKIGINGQTLSPSISNSTAPSSSATTMTNIATWYNGNIASAGGEQWFKFLATSATQGATTVTQYIFIQTGTLSSLYAQIYDKTGRRVGSAIMSYTYSTYNSQSSLTVGEEYYIKVTPRNASGTNSSGAYKIGFGTTTSSSSFQ